MRLSAGLILLFLCSGGASALEPRSPATPAAPPPPFSTSLLSRLQQKEALDAVQVSRNSDSVVMETTGPVPEPWNAQIHAVADAPIAAGDVVLLEAELVVARVDPDLHESKVQFVLQRATEPFDGGDEEVFFPSPGHQTLRVPLKAATGLPAGAWQIAINFGFGRQRVVLNRLEVTNLGPAEPNALRSPPPTYGGREPDAGWRASAEARIEQIRKGDFTVRVRDAGGNPVSDADVHVRLRRHSFAFGTAVVGRRLVGESPDDRRYQQIVAEHFNLAVFENDMKWVAWESGDAGARQEHRERTLAAVKWLAANQIRVRGHCLVWPGYGSEKSRYMPDDIRPMVRAGDTAGLRRRIAAHIADVAGTFAGTMEEWDVVNEPVFNQVLQRALGPDAMAEWFRLARRADPAAKLYLNDFTMLSYGAVSRGNVDSFYQNASGLIDRGAPIDGIGEQAHFNSTLVGINDVLARLDRFEKLGLPIRITEFDVASDDPSLQCDYLRDFFTAAFSHPAVNGIVQWGFWQKHHWKPQAALWAEDWSLRPHGRVYLDLIHRVWHTEQAGRTTPAGEFVFRGFRGDYEVVVRRGSASITVEIPFADATASNEVVLP